MILYKRFACTADWMFLIDQRVMLNRTAMSKFGVNLGSVTLSFSRQRP